MAIRYVSNTGSNTSPYDTKAKAATSFANAMTGSSAGDEFRFDHTWSHSVAASIIYDGGTGAGRRLISWDFTNDVPAAGGTISQSSGSWFTWQGNWYGEGMTFTTSSNGIRFGDTGNAAQWFRGCKFRITSGNGSHGFGIGRGDLATNIAQSFKFTQPEFYFSHSSQWIALGSGDIWISEMSLASGTTTPTYLFTPNGSSRAAPCRVNGLNVSPAGNGINLVYNAGAACTGGLLRLDNVRVPGSWSGSVCAGSGNYAVKDFRVEVGSISGGDNRYGHFAVGWNGRQRTETTLVMTGAPQIESTPISWRIETTSGLGNHFTAYRSLPIVFPCTQVGSSKTFTVELLRDSATNLTDHNIWAELAYLGSSGYTMALLASSKPSPSVSATDLASSSVTWTTTGMSNPNKQKITITCTPQEVGWYALTLWVDISSAVLYVNPAVAIS